MHLSGMICCVVMLSKEFRTKYRLCCSDSLSSICGVEASPRSWRTSRLRSSISFSQRAGQLNFLSFLQKQKQRQSRLLQKFLEATSSHVFSNFALHRASSASFCLSRGTTMARATSALGFLIMMPTTSPVQMLLRMRWTRGCVRRLVRSMILTAACRESRLESISYFSSSFRSSCSSNSFLRVIRKLPSVPSGTDTHSRLSTPSSGLLGQLRPKFAQPSGMRMQELPTCCTGQRWSTSSLSAAKMVTLLRLASSSSAYWQSMLKKETSVKQMGSSSDLNSRSVMMHRRQTQMILLIYFRRQCRQSRCRNSCSDSSSICILFPPEALAGADCSDRSHPSTESRMPAALGFSRASLRTRSREGAEVSGGEYSLARQRLRSSSSSGTSATMSWRTLRKVEMQSGAVLGESRQAKSSDLRWSQVSVFWICENRATECLWNCCAVSIFIIYSQTNRTLPSPSLALEMNTDGCSFSKSVLLRRKADSGLIFYAQNFCKIRSKAFC